MLFLVKLTISCLLVLSPFGLAQGYAQDRFADYIGPWKQVRSNAGHCSRCEITLDRGAGGLTVKANNGWTATVRLVGYGSRAYLDGQGAWADSVRGDLRGKRFDAMLTIVDNELHLAMKIPLETGRLRVIRGVFRKHWVGS